MNAKINKSAKQSKSLHRGNPAGYVAIAESLKHGIQPDKPRVKVEVISQRPALSGVSALAESLKRGNAYVEAQKAINDKCLTGVATATNVFKAAVIAILLTGFSFASMAQTKPKVATSIAVISRGQTAWLTVDDTTYLNQINKYTKSTIYNYRSGGMIKNNEMADLILAILKARK